MTKRSLIMRKTLPVF